MNIYGTDKVIKQVGAKEEEMKCTSQLAVPVEDCEFRNEGFVNGEDVGIEAIHDVLGHGGGVVHGVSLLGKPVHRGWGSRRRVVGVRPEYLLSNGLERVTWVRVDVVRLVLEEDALRVWVSGVESVGLGTIHAVYFRVESLHPPDHVVERPVLHNQHHHGLDGAAAAVAAMEANQKQQKCDENGAHGTDTD